LSLNYFIKFHFLYFSNSMKKGTILENLFIESVSNEGKGISRYDGKVYFVDKAVRNDEVNIAVTRSKSGFGEGRIDSFIKKSNFRKEADCNHFGDCGGCKFQHIQYEEQLNIKDKIAYDALIRIGKLNINQFKSIIKADKLYAYRNKMEYAFSEKKWRTKNEMQIVDDAESINGLGFHIKGCFDKVINIDNCLLQDDIGNKIRNETKKIAQQFNMPFYNPRTHVGLLRSLYLRNNKANEWMITLVLKEKDEQAIKIIFDTLHHTFPQIISFNYVINHKVNDSIFDLEVFHYSGAKYLIEKLENVSFKISPKSFFQTNSYQAEKLYNIVKAHISAEKDLILYDLYCGTGSIGQYVADVCKKVVGIDEIYDAIENAKENAALNKIKNAHYFSGDCKKILDADFINLNGFPDVIITDPPRAGMHDDVLKTLLAAECKMIIYVSCNPSTQARDLAILSEKYVVLESQAIDMFPQTPHVENVVLLQLKQKD
jgi:23S rRNA (uracil1939-C5)-methyltransferase